MSEWVEKYNWGRAPQSFEAAESIRQIGTNGIPYLLKWASCRFDILGRKGYRGGPAAFVLDRLVQSLGSQAVRPLIQAMKDNPKNLHIFNCLIILGTNAEDAVPALQKLLVHPALEVRTGATNALFRINFQSLNRSGDGKG